MKFVLAYTLRPGGSLNDRLEAAERSQKLLANWQPSKAATIHQWVNRCDGNGGFAVVENDDANELLRDLATWSPWLEFSVYPVVDIADAIGLQQDAITIARSAG